MTQFERPRLQWEMTKPWPRSHRVSLGASIEYLPMGTTIDHKTEARRPWSVCTITFHLLVRKLSVSMSVWTD